MAEGLAGGAWRIDPADPCAECGVTFEAHGREPHGFTLFVIYRVGSWTEGD